LETVLDSRASRSDSNSPDDEALAVSQWRGGINDVGGEFPIRNGKPCLFCRPGNPLKLGQ
jgi:hypothetical protein